MTDEDFQADLALLAGHVEEERAQGILVDVTRFRHKPGPEVQPGRVKNISSRYHAAGVTRFAFLFPEGSPIPPLMSQSSPGKNFLDARVCHSGRGNKMAGRERWTVLALRRLVGSRPGLAGSSSE
jgi:hypothetical protein